jgi:glycerol-3-phosphate dehydrogenase
MSAPDSPRSSNRSALFARLAEQNKVDMVVVGGGATGLGVALDAVLRGLSVVLLESHDFAKGTSSRATKLVHGGVRYLAQGNIALVREALHERTTLLRNAPHLASPLAFVMPSYKCWETPFYGVGLKMYDALAGKAGLGSTQFLGAAQTRRAIPGVRDTGLKGGVKYWDGQFDDARLALALARTAAAQGALLINYCEVTGLLHHNGKVAGVTCRDTQTGTTHTVHAGCVVNATGVWVDALRTLDGQASGRPAQPMVAPSQGVHLVVDAEFLPGDHALLVPKTHDGRVLFAVPWLGKVILGTTDTPRTDLSYEPRAFDHEIRFILDESARYLRKAPTLANVKSLWVGLRPLVRPPADESGNTKKISREHTVLVSPGGLVTVTGGKWTTYRAMAEDVLAKCISAGLVTAAPRSRTASFPLVGATGTQAGSGAMSQPAGLHSYGSEACAVQALPGADVSLAPGLTEAMVRFAARYEYALTVEDVLARRSRLLFLDARLAASVAPRVASILHQELSTDAQLPAFLDLAQMYLPPSGL